MIRLFPRLSYDPKCPDCNVTLTDGKIIWQGIHTLFHGKCHKCGNNFYVTFPVGHALPFPITINEKTWEMNVSPVADKWLGKPLLKSLQNPLSEKINFQVKKFKNVNKVTILNCIDYLFGHSLLKLLNSERILKLRKEGGLVVIVPKLLEWMVPDGVAEIWSIDLPLKKSTNFYLNLNEKINKELERFSDVQIDRAYSHPDAQNIADFSRENAHDFKSRDYKITFIWREDRPWFFSDYISYGLKRVKLDLVLIIFQNIKIQILFRIIRRSLPKASFCVAGIGNTTTFPSWIDDKRFSRPSPVQERILCKAYSKSRIVIGVHGSNMLLPTAHAGMTIDLLPNYKIGNIAQDILYRKSERALINTYDYRILPISTSIMTIARNAVCMISGRDGMLKLLDENEHNK